MTNWIPVTKGAKKRSFAMLGICLLMGIGSLVFCLALFLYQVIFYPAAWVAGSSLAAILLIAFSIGEKNAQKETNQQKD